MKAVTVTTLMALIMAIPFLLGKRRTAFSPVKERVWRPGDEFRRYDIEDFIS